MEAFLVGQGLYQPRDRRRLFVSARTVSHTLGMLGVATRRDLRGCRRRLASLP